MGYRVSSARATQFRQWATRTPKQHLVDGYTLNQRRLQERGVEFGQAVELLSRTLANRDLIAHDGQAVLSVIQDYARSWSLLAQAMTNKAWASSMPVNPRCRRWRWMTCWRPSHS